MTILPLSLIAMTGDTDFAKAISYEVKKDMAERYFGFRRLIEDDKLDLKEKSRQYAFILEKRLCFDLIRIYTLLQEEKLIDDFLDLTGLAREEWFDPYLLRSTAIRTRVFHGLKLRGLTRWRRFYYLLCDCYQRLAVHAELYQENLIEMKELRQTINEEIRIFRQNHDLAAIIVFLRSLGDSQQIGNLEGGLETGMAASLEKKMAISPPLPLASYLPPIKPFPSLDQAAAGLKNMARKAYGLHSKKQQIELTRKKQPAPRP